MFIQCCSSLGPFLQFHYSLGSYLQCHYLLLFILLLSFRWLLFTLFTWLLFHFDDDALSQLCLPVDNAVVGDGASGTIFVAVCLPHPVPRLLTVEQLRRGVLSEAAVALAVARRGSALRLTAEDRLIVVEVLRRSATENVHKDAAELLPEDAVEHEVDGAVGDHHEAADACELDERRRVEHLRWQCRHENVVDDGRHLTNEEDGDDGDDHHREVVLAPLAVGHLPGDALRPLDRATQLQVEHGEQQERNDEHHAHVHVDEVDVAEHRVGAECRVHIHRLRHVRDDVARHDDAVLQHARDVVDDGAEEDREDRLLGTARVAHLCCTQRVAHRDEALNREADCQIDGAGLGYEGGGVGVRMEVRVDPVITLQLSRCKVYNRQRHEEHQRYQHDRVK